MNVMPAFSLTDSWVQLAPLGEFPHRESGLTQVIDGAALRSMVNRFAQESAAPEFPGLLVDFDHFSQDPARPSEAAGWIGSLEGRDDGLYGKIRWSDAGLSAVTSGRYRLISPVWNPDEAQNLGNGRIRPLRLDRCGLTNDPNLPVRPLSNRNGQLGSPGDSAGAARRLSNRAMELRRAHPGWSWDRAWGAATAEHPDLYAAASIQNRQSSGAPIAARFTGIHEAGRPGAGRVSAAVSRILTNRTRELQQAHGWNFSRAWNAALAEQPSALISNRVVGHVGGLEVHMTEAAGRTPPAA